MSLEDTIKKDLLTAMKAKDEAGLRGIRAIKAAILQAKTDGSGKPVDEARELAILQKLVKSRQDSIAIYKENGRDDLAKVEEEEVVVIKRYLPEMLEGAELEAKIKEIIDQVGASGPGDMGKVMGVATKALAGKAEGRAIADTVKSLLNR